MFLTCHPSIHPSMIYNHCSFSRIRYSMYFKVSYYLYKKYILNKFHTSVPNVQISHNPAHRWSPVGSRSLKPKSIIKTCPPGQCCRVRWSHASYGKAAQLICIWFLILPASHDKTDETDSYWSMQQKKKLARSLLIREAFHPPSPGCNTKISTTGKKRKF